MRSRSLTPGRLAGAAAGAAVAAAACAAALVPGASLAATRAPATASTPGCSTAGLVVWIDTQGSGYAGGTGYNLKFTNLSGHACTLHGNPGVSAVSLAGGQLGKPAGWTGSPGTVTLASGGTASAALLITDVGVYPLSQCSPVLAAGLRVYPPGQTAAKVIPFPFSACSASGPVYLAAGPLHS
jgi:hypothetical protein